MGEGSVADCLSADYRELLAATRIIDEDMYELVEDMQRCRVAAPSIRAISQ